MRTIRCTLLLSAVGALLGLSECGSGEELMSISVTPVSRTATSGTTNDSVQFTATGQYVPTGCGSYNLAPCAIDKTQVLTNATWSTSDGSNTTVDAKGLATCVSATSTPAKIIASAPGPNGLVSGSASLSCS
jgi:hypothetical protein